MTQNQLEEKAGLCTNHLGSVERKEKTPALETFIVIVSALGISADFLLCDILENGYQVKSSVLSEKHGKASPAKRSSILEVVDIMLRNV